MTYIPLNQPVVSLIELWERGLVTPHRDEANNYSVRWGGAEWPISAHAYLVMAIRDTPAFWTEDRLAWLGLENAPAFDRKLFAVRYDRLPAGEQAGDEPIILAALNARREEFLLLARLCFRQAGVRWQLRLTWGFLWLLEWRAGLVERL
ncbi:MAG: hypothetical protein KJ077_11090 [Anaerolineae bacterium]|nr:hypothetical protein [Anaerolineae bacterium]